MANSYTIKGVEDVGKFFDAQPANVVRLTRKAMQAGGRAGAKAIRTRVDKRFAYLVKAKTGKERGGDNLRTRLGLFNGGEVDGTQPKNGKVTTFFKAYWLNYGTLEGRDPSYDFAYPVKHERTAAAQQRRNRTGEMHTNFFEKASAGVEGIYLDAFEKYVNDHIDDMYRR